MSRRLYLTGLLSDTRGLSKVEYIVTVGVVGIVLATTFVLRGDQLLADYVNARNLFLVPVL
jgi:hypothetical protein